VNPPILILATNPSCRSPIQSTPRRARRGDIHSSAPVSSPSFGRGGRREVALGNGNANGHANGAPPSDVLNSEGGLNIPSSMPVLSAQAAASDIPDNGVVRVIWGTDVNLMDSMSIFTDFIQNFKAKYRRAYDREHGDPTAVAAFPEFNAEDGEKVVYEGYLRKMRLTSQTNLNLDALNLLAYPPSKKLFSQLVKYPQEIIPIMDQVLKDQMVQLAEEDQRDGMDGMEGEIGDEEINEIIGRVYKVRPFGIPCVNMRDLNPSGM
jgi:DNA replication licensing factor MCM4